MFYGNSLAKAAVDCVPETGSCHLDESKWTAHAGSRMATRRKYLVQQIVSGGQTGVDRGALDAAIELGIPHGGWCPRGRLAEDGRIPEQYHLNELASTQYRARTEWNVRDSDGTLILFRETLRGGTELTRRFAVQYRKPHLLVDLDQLLDPTVIRQWIISESIHILNVAGPRESSSPGIAEDSRELLRSVFGQWHRQ